MEMVAMRGICQGGNVRVFEAKSSHAVCRHRGRVRNELEAASDK